VIKKLFYTTALLLTVLIGCKKDSTSGPLLAKDDAAFAIYETSFLDALWKIDPDYAISVGYHKYDSLMVVLTDKSRDKMINFTKVQLDSLSRFEVTTLNDANKIDYRLMQNEMEYIQWRIQTLRSYQWDPSAYNVIGTFASILNEHYAPLAKRLTNFYQRMVDIPAYYKEAEKQIKNPVAELTGLAIDQHMGGVGVFEKDFEDSLKKKQKSRRQNKN